MGGATGLVYLGADGSGPFAVVGPDANGPLPVAASPPATGGSGGVQVQTTAVASSSLILKAAPCVGLRYAVLPTVAGFMMVFDAVAAPADGAVVPAICAPVAANARVEIDHSNAGGDKYLNGCVVVFSTTGPFNKTASATAKIEGQAV